jgi:hypothetical protein
MRHQDPCTGARACGTVKSVILLGDSIRLHYQPLVTQALYGLADISGPAENCRCSKTIMDNLGTWAIAPCPDIVHLNCGAHDIRHDRDGVGPLVPLNDYVANLESIFARLSRETSATLVWATTTPVIETRHQAVRDSTRYAADVTSYNTAALAVAERHGALINDLHATVMSAGADDLLKTDGLHFTDSGSAFLAKRVVESLMPLL